MCLRYWDKTSNINDTRLRQWFFSTWKSNYIPCCKLSIAPEKLAKLPWSSGIKNFKASRTLIGSTIYTWEKVCKLRNHPFLRSPKSSLALLKHQVQSAAQTSTAHRCLELTCLLHLSRWNTWKWSERSCGFSSKCRDGIITQAKIKPRALKLVVIMNCKFLCAN